ncbi:fumarylacetoacetate hydrolase [Pseudarcicella hirudinis]|uniref:fumarylacetoacetase n=1 Tax=Pseudarcicella hirudinis TaxID=1079859 RepID=A0A1I5MLU8_9BACT|nr:fumarylacetoacetase [Pseudarcicella hirudinis]SFP10480.1 fumarylacetoacetate hydrolase [Pseudarcicella hirudinis]
MQKDLKSWLEISAHSDFSIYNLPYGVFSTNQHADSRVGVALGEYIIDLWKLSPLLEEIHFDRAVFLKAELNDFIALGKSIHTAVRQRITDIFTTEDTEIQNIAKKTLIKQSEVVMHLPVKIGDYTDFYSSIEHATNVGKMFRDPENALLPNWKHLPVAYHGRASSIRVSGTDFHRPKGQIKPNDSDSPVFSPSKSLDFELEIGLIIGKNSEIGESVSTEQAENYIFGLVLFNDWSARDIQKWEYVPLGPFLAKNFFSSISPWVVTMEAMEPFKSEGPEQNPPVLDYLTFSGAKNYDIQLSVEISAENGASAIVSQTNFKYMYWNMAQQIAHHTVNGCNLNIGDILASGTISGSEPTSFGSMLELTWGGKNPIKLSENSERKFIQDFDTVTMRGFSQKEGIKIGFGEVSNKVLPSK